MTTPRRMMMGAAGVLPTEFPTLTDIKWRHRADTGITGDPVTAWTDMVGDADLTNTAGNPDFQATGGPNGEPAVVFDGIAAIMAVDGVTPIAAPYHFFYVAKQITWTSGELLASLKAASATHFGRATGSSPSVNMRNVISGNDNSGMVLGEWHLLEGWYGSEITDYLRVDNGAKSTGTDTGSQTNLTRLVFCGDDNMVSLPANWAIAEAVHCAGGSEVTGADHAQLMGYFRDRYAIDIA